MGKRNKYTHLSNDELINIFKKEYNRIKPLTCSDFYAKAVGVPSLYVYKDRNIARSWNEMLAIIDGNIKSLQLTDKEFKKHCEKLLKSHIKRHKKAPTSKEFYKYPLTNAHRIKSMYGS